MSHCIIFLPGNQHQHQQQLHKCIEMKIVNFIELCIHFHRWILFGDLQDPYEEFFVGLIPQAQTKLSSYSMWQDTYFLRKAMLPSFFSSALATKILVIGKTINFIRICLSKLPKKTIKQSNKRADKRTSRLIGRKSMKELLTDSESGGGAVTSNSSKENMNSDDINDWLVSSDNIDDTTLQGLRYGGEEQLAEAVNRISHITDSKLLKLMEERCFHAVNSCLYLKFVTRFSIYTALLIFRFYLTEHLLALKKFLLLGQVINKEIKNSFIQHVFACHSDDDWSWGFYFGRGVFIFLGRLCYLFDGQCWK